MRFLRREVHGSRFARVAGIRYVQCHVIDPVGLEICDLAVELPEELCPLPRKQLHALLAFEGLSYSVCKCLLPQLRASAGA